MGTANTHLAYTETIRHRSETHICVLAAHLADQLVERAHQLRCEITATPDGVITLDRPHTSVTITLAPRFSPKKLTDVQARDLASIKVRPTSHLTVRLGQITIVAGLYRIPPAATRRLLERGWVSVPTLEDGAPVRVSVAGRVALARHEDRSADLRAAVLDYTA